jgi:hypothetical protein
MYKNEYPNPLRSPTKLIGKLSKKRKSDLPPIDKDQLPYLAVDGYPGICQDKDEYQEKFGAWVDRQSDLDNEGFSLLADHYGIDRNDPNLYKYVALNLCRDFVPFFQMPLGTSSIRKSPQNSWTAITLQLLLVRVEIKQRQLGGTRKEAIAIINKEYKYNTENLWGRINEAEKLKDNKEFIKDASMKMLKLLEKKLELYDRVAQLEHHLWLGETKENAQKKYLKLRSQLEKKGLAPDTGK